MAEKPQDAPANANVTPLRKAVPCPMCGKPSSRADYPFCSARCRDLDLNRWLTGGYKIEAVESEVSSDEPDQN
ncbi:MAG: DNA gyrase inhibitor YacG [Pseudomonadota bacterium]